MACLQLNIGDGRPWGTEAYMKYEECGLVNHLCSGGASDFKTSVNVRVGCQGVAEADCVSAKAANLKVEWDSLRERCNVDSTPTVDAATVCMSNLKGTVRQPTTCNGSLTSNLQIKMGNGMANMPSDVYEWSAAACDASNLGGATRKSEQIALKDLCCTSGKSACEAVADGGYTETSTAKECKGSASTGGAGGSSATQSPSSGGDSTANSASGAATNFGAAAVSGTALLLFCAALM